MKKILLVMLLSAGIPFAGTYWLLTSGTISDADKRRYGQQCQRWISSEFGEGRSARVSDSWRKNGKIVFEVLVDRETGSMADVFLCVVDKAAGSMRKPSAFDQSWR